MTSGSRAHRVVPRRSTLDRFRPTVSGAVIGALIVVSRASTGDGTSSGHDDGERAKIAGGWWVRARAVHQGGAEVFLWLAIALYLLRSRSRLL